MIENRSVPTNTVLPHIYYQNVADAIDWLSKAFGFAEHYRYGDPEAIGLAQMHLGNAWIMLKRARMGGASLRTWLRNAKPDSVRSRWAGAKIVEDLT
jgi:uncharacterized glyoxalase superfamily protein PhnB